MQPFIDVFSGELMPWLSLMLTWFVKGALVLSAAGILAYALRNSAAAVRYLVWSAALLSLMALPVLSFVLPAWRVPVLPQVALEAPVPPEAPAAPDAPLPPVPPIVDGVSPVAPVPSADAIAPAPAPSPAPAILEAPVVAPSTAPPPSALRSEHVSAGGLLAFWNKLTDAFNGLHWTTWLFLVWVAGLVVVFGRLLIAHASISLLLRRSALVHDDAWHLLTEKTAQRLDMSAFVRLRWSAWTAVPLTVGIFRPIIILPEEARGWDMQRREVVLLHELAHIKRHDCLVQLLTQVTCAIHWFNPLVWVAARQLRIERERACDDVVLMAGTRATDYAETLLETARSLRSAEWVSVAALAMARRSQLEGRLLAILDARLQHRTLSRAGSILALALMACIVLPLAALTPAQAQETPPAADTLEAPLPDRVPVLMRDPGVTPEPAIDPGLDPDYDFDFEYDFDFDFDPDYDFDFDFDFDIDPDVDFDVDGGNWNYNFNYNYNENTNDGGAYDPVLDEVVSDTLSIEQLIRLRRYGVDADFIRGMRDLGYTNLTVGELINLSKYGADPEYIAELHAAGFTNLSLDELVRMAKYGFDSDLVASLNRLGYTGLSVDDLITMSKYGVDEDLIESLSAVGYTDLSADDLITMSKYGVDEDLIVAMRDLGYASLPVDDLVALSKYGVDDDFVRAMAQHGYADLPVDDLVALSKYGVDEDLIAGLGRHGYTNLSVDALVAMSKYGVDEDLIAALAQRGYTNLPVDELTAASKYGVDGDFIEEMDASGIGELSLEELARLAKYGVDADYVKELRDAGLTTFTVEQLIEMRKHGLDGDFIRSMQDN